MDYDKTAIAATYDAARGLDPDGMTRWLDLVAAHAPPNPALIVDVGCGTGRFTYPLAERFGARTVGVDPSARMLQEARGKAQGRVVEFLQAPAEQMPLENGCADIVFMSMMLHHLADRAHAARECRRVLRPQGRVCVRNSTRDCRFPQVRFFPGFRTIADAQLPSRDEVIAVFERAGLRLCAYQLVSQPLAANWQEFADKLALRADSFIVRLPMNEFEAGMAAVRAHAARSGANDAIVDHLSFFVFEVTT